MEATATNGRGSNGRFAPGNHFGVTGGRPAQLNKTEYLTALSDELTPEVWRKIVHVAVQDATEGTGRERASAREWFGKYVLPQKLELNVTGLSNHSGNAVADINDDAELKELQARLDAGEIELYSGENGETYFREIAPNPEPEASDTAK